MSADQAREGIGRRRILDIITGPDEPSLWLYAATVVVLSVVSSGVGIGVGVRFDESTGVGRWGPGCAIAGAGGGGTYIRSSGVSSSSSSASPMHSSPSSELIPPSNSNSCPNWCERRVPKSSVYRINKSIK